MDLKNYLSEKKKIVEDYMEQLLPASSSIPVINEAMRYSLFAGGKRLRPILAIMTCELLGGSTEEVMPFACSLEMIHTYSLIHDDLPAMDNDDYRRGRLTNHKVYGDGFAVLAGDALLNYAFETMLRAASRCPQPRYIRAMAGIAEASGISGMIGGQCIDLYYENKQIDIDTLKTMHNKKTGAMILAALLTGAIISDASEQDISRISKYGSNIGLAFQIADDILDIEGSTEKLGKKTGSDESNKKSTFVTLYGLEKSKQIERELIEEAKAQLEIYGEKAFYLRELADFIINREY